MDDRTIPDSELTPARRWLILASITAATSLYAMAILIVSVVLPQMQGSLSATPDQIAWVMTFNILATAVVTPMTPLPSTTTFIPCSPTTATAGRQW